MNLKLLKQIKKKEVKIKNLQRFFMLNFPSCLNVIAIVKLKLNKQPYVFPVKNSRVWCLSQQGVFKNKQRIHNRLPGNKKNRNHIKKKKAMVDCLNLNHKLEKIKSQRWLIKTINNKNFILNRPNKIKKILPNTVSIKDYTIIQMALWLYNQLKIIQLTLEKKNLIRHYGLPWLIIHQEHYNQALMPFFLTEADQFLFDHSFSAFFIQKKILTLLNRTKPSIGHKQYIKSISKRVTWGRRSTPTRRSAPTTPTLWGKEWGYGSKIIKINAKKYEQFLLNHHRFSLPLFKIWVKRNLIKDNFFGFQNMSFSLQETLMNNILNDLQHELQYHICLDYENNLNSNPDFHTLRFNSQFLLISRNFFLLTRLKNLLKSILNNYGLNINQKSYIQNLDQGFDFLGWTFQKPMSSSVYSCFIASKSLIDHQQTIKYLTKTIHKPEVLILNLNKIIKNWLHYNQNCSQLKSSYDKLNYYLFHRLIKWGKRRHSNKTARWIIKRYWKKRNTKFTFYFRSCDNKEYFLTRYHCLNSAS